jgi:hypothetical protein
VRNWQVTRSSYGPHLHDGGKTLLESNKEKRCGTERKLVRTALHVVVVAFSTQFLETWQRSKARSLELSLGDSTILVLVDDLKNGIDD